MHENFHGPPARGPGGARLPLRACFAAPLPALAQAAANATADAFASGVNNLPSTSSYGGEIMRVVGVMCLILALLFAALWLLKRYGRRAGAWGFRREHPQGRRPDSLGAQKAGLRGPVLE